jgi:hypothetical protein
MIEAKTESEFKANLLKIRSLRDGWLDGESKAPSKELLDWFESWFFDFYKENFPRLEYPSLFAVFDGGYYWSGFCRGSNPAWTFPQKKQDCYTP